MVRSTLCISLSSRPRTLISLGLTEHRAGIGTFVLAPPGTGTQPSPALGDAARNVVRAFDEWQFRTKPAALSEAVEELRHALGDSSAFTGPAGHGPAVARHHLRLRTAPPTGVSSDTGSGALSAARAIFRAITESDRVARVGSAPIIHSRLCGPAGDGGVQIIYSDAVGIHPNLRFWQPYVVHCPRCS